VCYSPTSRPVFAEGLASSYEAFLQTRRLNLQSKGRNNGPLIDYDGQLADRVCIEKASEWYLNRLESILPQGDSASSLSHPKIRATVERTKELWKAGEKVVVFCHYVATGRTLRQRISESIRWEIIELGRRRLHCAANEVEQELERIGRRFFVEDSPIRRACVKKVSSILVDFPSLMDLEESLHDIVLRNVRTSSFLVRYFPIQRERRLTEGDMITAFRRQDKSGLTLEALVRDFFCFLDGRCSSDERYAYIDALSSVQTGSYKADDVTRSYSPDELQGGQVEHLLPNVRLVNGSTRSETRQRLLLTFNTPFYPEVLVASSVMAEGVDLHLYCRHIIHHDLSWNPSTLEQRTGRLDRIGAKIERCCQPLRVYIPYIMETQDERMYRVVMDREKWFKVVMGEDYKVDGNTTERISNRLPLPEAIVEELTLHLEV
jgi:ERCC4-related helicase